MKFVAKIPAIAAIILTSIATPVAAQNLPNNFPGTTPTLDRQNTLPQLCFLRVIVPVQRTDPASTVTAAVEVRLLKRGDLLPQNLGEPRVNDTGSAIAFTFNRPSGSCNQPVRAIPRVSCIAHAAGVNATFTNTYEFPSKTGFADLTEITIPQSC